MNLFKNILITLTSFVFFTNNGFGQTISIKNSIYSGAVIRFAEHYGDQIFLKREVKADENGNCLIYNSELESGIYYLIFPDSSTYEVLYDKLFPGKISLIFEAKSGKLIESPVPTKEFAAYNEVLSNIILKQDSLRHHLKQADLKKKHRKSLEIYREHLNIKRDSALYNTYINNKDNFFGLYLKAKLKIIVPEYEGIANSEPSDSAIWAWRTSYYQKHYLDNVVLDDDRLIRTPVFTTKINTYLDKITLQDPEQLKSAINLIISQADKNPVTKEFVTNYLLTKYNKLKNNPVYEVAFLYIIKEYYLNQTASWVTNEDLSKLSIEYNRRKPLELGQKAPGFRLFNLDNEVITLDSVQSDNIILYFLSTECDHCKQTTAELNRLIAPFESAFAQVFAVCLDSDDKSCIKYLSDNFDNTNTTCGYGENLSQEIALSYNLAFTPTIYLLNRKKEITSKNLTINQLSGILHGM